MALLLPALLLLGAAAPARAQLGVSAAVQSDYRYRGLSLSEGRPTAGLNVAFDHPSGVYAGGTIAAVDTDRHGVKPFGRTVYLGYASRTRGGRTWDVGATNAKIKYYGFANLTVDYTEIYAGSNTEHTSVRVYYAPDYFEQGIKTVYVDLGATYRPRPNWRVFGHLGVLTPVGGRSTARRRDRYDVSAGVATTIKDCELSLTVSTTTPRTGARGRRLDRNAVVLGGAYFF